MLLFIANFKQFFKGINLLVLISFLATSSGCLQGAGGAAAPVKPLISQNLVNLSQVKSYPVLRGIKIDPQDPLKFQFLVDRNGKDYSKDELRSQMAPLVRYFLAGVTIPKKELWVNLSPYEPDRVATSSLGAVGLGETLLKQDYILKQLAASLTFPETDAGKKYWQELNGTNNFQKVWIVPDDIVVYEDGEQATIKSAKLKVLMEDDYLAAQNNSGVGANLCVRPNDNGQTRRSAPTDAFKKNILPLIEKDVNEGENFAPLRQTFYSLILANWFKEKLKAAQDNAYSQLYVDKKKDATLQASAPDAKQKVYEDYVEAFKRGAYNYVKKDLDATRRKIIKKQYYSGGVTFGDMQTTNLPRGVEADKIDAACAADNIQLKPVDAENGDASLAPGIVGKRSVPTGETVAAMPTGKQALPAPIVAPMPNAPKQSSEPNQSIESFGQKVKNAWIKFAAKMRLGLGYQNRCDILLSALELSAQRDGESREVNLNAYRQDIAQSIRHMTPFGGEVKVRAVAKRILANVQDERLDPSARGILLTAVVRIAEIYPSCISLVTQMMLSDDVNIELRKNLLPSFFEHAFEYVLFIEAIDDKTISSFVDLLNGPVCSGGRYKTMVRVLGHVLAVRSDKDFTLKILRQAADLQMDGEQNPVKDIFEEYLIRKHKDSSWLHRELTIDGSDWPLILDDLVGNEQFEKLLFSTINPMALNYAELVAAAINSRKPSPDEEHRYLRKAMAIKFYYNQGLLLGEHINWDEFDKNDEAFWTLVDIFKQPGESFDRTIAQYKGHLDTVDNFMTRNRELASVGANDHSPVVAIDPALRQIFEDTYESGGHEGVRDMLFAHHGFLPDFVRFIAENKDANEQRQMIDGVSEVLLKSGMRQKQRLILHAPELKILVALADAEENQPSVAGALSVALKGNHELVSSLIDEIKIVSSKEVRNWFAWALGSAAGYREGPVLTMDILRSLLEAGREDGETLVHEAMKECLKKVKKFDDTHNWHVGHGAAWSEILNDVQTVHFYDGVIEGYVDAILSILTGKEVTEQEESQFIYMAMLLKYQAVAEKDGLPDNAHFGSLIDAAIKNSAAFHALTDIFKQPGESFDRTIKQYAGHLDTVEHFMARNKELARTPVIASEAKQSHDGADSRDVIHHVSNQDATRLPIQNGGQVNGVSTTDAETAAQPIDPKLQAEFERALSGLDGSEITRDFAADMLAKNPQLLPVIISAINVPETSDDTRGQLAYALGRALANNKELLQPMIAAINADETSDPTRGQLAYALGRALANNKELLLSKDDADVLIKWINTTKTTDPTRGHLADALARDTVNKQDSVFVIECLRGIDTKYKDKAINIAQEYLSSSDVPANKKNLHQGLTQENANWTNILDGAPGVEIDGSQRKLYIDMIMSALTGKAPSTDEQVKFTKLAIELKYQAYLDNLRQGKEGEEADATVEGFVTADEFKAFVAFAATQDEAAFDALITIFKQPGESFDRTIKQYAGHLDTVEHFMARNRELASASPAVASQQQSSAPVIASEAKQSHDGADSRDVIHHVLNQDATPRQSSAQVNGVSTTDAETAAQPIDPKLQAEFERALSGLDGSEITRDFAADMLAKNPQLLPVIISAINVPETSDDTRGWLVNALTQALTNNKELLLSKDDADVLIKWINTTKTTDNTRGQLAYALKQALTNNKELLQPMIAAINADETSDDTRGWLVNALKQALTNNKELLQPMIAAINADETTDNTRRWLAIALGQALARNKALLLSKYDADVLIKWINADETTDNTRRWLAIALEQALARNKALLLSKDDADVLTKWIINAQGTSDDTRMQLAYALGRALANNKELLQPMIAAINADETSDPTRGHLADALARDTVNKQDSVFVIECLRGIDTKYKDKAINIAQEYLSSSDVPANKKNLHQGLTQENANWTNILDGAPGVEIDGSQRKLYIDMIMSALTGKAPSTDEQVKFTKLAVELKYQAHLNKLRQGKEGEEADATVEGFVTEDEFKTLVAFAATQNEAAFDALVTIFKQPGESFDRTIAQYKGCLGSVEKFLEKNRELAGVPVQPINPKLQAEFEVALDEFELNLDQAHADRVLAGIPHCQNQLLFERAMNLLRKGFTENNLVLTKEFWDEHAKNDISFLNDLIYIISEAVARKNIPGTAAAVFSRFAAVDVSEARWFALGYITKLNGLKRMGKEPKDMLHYGLETSGADWAIILAGVPVIVVRDQERDIYGEMILSVLLKEAVIPEQEKNFTRMAMVFKYYEYLESLGNGKDSVAAQAAIDGFPNEGEIGGFIEAAASNDTAFDALTAIFKQPGESFDRTIAQYAGHLDTVDNFMARNRELASVGENDDSPVRQERYQPTPEQLAAISADVEQKFDELLQLERSGKNGLEFGRLLEDNIQALPLYIAKIDDPEITPAERDNILGCLYTIMSNGSSKLCLDDAQGRVLLRHVYDDAVAIGERRLQARILARAVQRNADFVIDADNINKLLALAKDKELDKGLRLTLLWIVQENFKHKSNQHISESVANCLIDIINESDDYERMAKLPAEVLAFGITNNLDAKFTIDCLRKLLASGKDVGVKAARKVAFEYVSSAYDKDGFLHHDLGDASGDWVTILGQIGYFYMSAGEEDLYVDMIIAALSGNAVDSAQAEQFSKFMIKKRYSLRLNDLFEGEPLHIRARAMREFPTDRNFAEFVEQVAKNPVALDALVTIFKQPGESFDRTIKQYPKCLDTVEHFMARNKELQITDSKLQIAAPVARNDKTDAATDNLTIKQNISRLSGELVKAEAKDRAAKIAEISAGLLKVNDNDFAYSILIVLYGKDKAAASEIAKKYLAVNGHNFHTGKKQKEKWQWILQQMPQFALTDNAQLDDYIGLVFGPLTDADSHWQKITTAMRFKDLCYARMKGISVPDIDWQSLLKDKKGRENLAALSDIYMLPWTNRYYPNAGFSSIMDKLFGDFHDNGKLGKYGAGEIFSSVYRYMDSDCRVINELIGGEYAAYRGMRTSLTNPANAVAHFIFDADVDAPIDFLNPEHHALLRTHACRKKGIEIKLLPEQKHIIRSVSLDLAQTLYREGGIGRWLKLDGKVSFREAMRFQRLFARYYTRDMDTALVNSFDYFVTCAWTIYGRFVKPEQRDQFASLLWEVFTRKEYRTLFATSAAAAGRVLNKDKMMELFDYGVLESDDIPDAKLLPIQRKILAGEARASRAGMALEIFYKQNFPDIVEDVLAQKGKVLPVDFSGFSERKEFFGMHLTDDAGAVQWFKGLIDNVLDAADKDPNTTHYLVLNNPDFAKGELRLMLHPLILERTVILEADSTGNKPTRRKLPANVKIVVVNHEDSRVNDESFENRFSGLHLPVPEREEAISYLERATGIDNKGAARLMDYFARLRADNNLSTYFGLSDILRVAYFIAGRQKGGDSSEGVVASELYNHCINKLSLENDPKQVAALQTIFPNVAPFAITINDDSRVIDFGGVKIPVDSQSRFGAWLAANQGNYSSFADALEKFLPKDYFITESEAQIVCLLAREYAYSPSKVIYLKGLAGVGKTTVARVFLDIIGSQVLEYTANKETGLGLLRGSMHLAKNGIEVQDAQYWRDYEKDNVGLIINEGDARMALMQSLWAEIAGRTYRVGGEFASRDANNPFNIKRRGKNRMVIITGNARNDLAPQLAEAMPASYAVERSNADVEMINRRLFDKRGLLSESDRAQAAGILSDIFNLLRKDTFAGGQAVTPRENERFIELFKIAVESGKYTHEEAFSFLMDVVFVRMFNNDADMDKARVAIAAVKAKNQRALVKAGYLDLPPPNTERYLGFIRDFDLEVPIMIFTNDTVEFSRIRKAVVPSGAQENIIDLTNFHSSRNLVAGINRPDPENPLANHIGILAQLILEANCDEAEHYDWLVGYTNINPQVSPLFNEFFPTGWLPVSEVFDENIVEAAWKVIDAKGGRELLEKRYQAVMGKELPQDATQYRSELARFAISHKPQNLKFRALCTAEEQLNIHPADLDRFLSLNLSEPINEAWLEAEFKGTEDIIGSDYYEDALSYLLTAYKYSKQETDGGVYPYLRLHPAKVRMYVAELKRAHEAGDLDENMLRLIAYHTFGIGLTFKEDQAKGDIDYREKFLSDIGLDLENVEYGRSYRNSDDGNAYFELHAVIDGKKYPLASRMTRYAHVEDKGNGYYEVNGQEPFMRLQAPLPGTLQNQLSSLIFERNGLSTVLEGDPGSSKTSSQRDLSTALGIGYYEEGMFKGVAMGVLLGSFTPRAREIFLNTLDKDPDGAYILRFLATYYGGGIFVADEGRVSKGADSLLRWLSSIAFRGKIDLGDYHPGLRGVEIVRSADFSFKVTQNFHFHTEGRQAVGFEANNRCGNIRADNRLSYKSARMLIDYYLESSPLDEALKDKLAKGYILMANSHPQKRMISPRDLIDIVTTLRNTESAKAQEELIEAMTMNYVDALLEDDQKQKAIELMAEIFSGYAGCDYADVKLYDRGFSNVNHSDVAYLEASPFIEQRLRVLEKIFSTTSRHVLVNEPLGGLAVDLVKLFASRSGRRLVTFQCHGYSTAKQLLGTETFEFEGSFDSQGKLKAKDSFRRADGALKELMVKEAEMATYPDGKKIPTIFFMPNIDTMAKNELVKINEAIASRRIMLPDEEGRLVEWVIPPWVTIVATTDNIDELTSPFANRFRKIGMPALTISTGLDKVLQKNFPAVTSEEIGLFDMVNNGIMECEKASRFMVRYENSVNDLWNLAMYAQMAKQADAARGELNTNPLWYVFKAIWTIYAKELLPADNEIFMTEVLPRVIAPFAPEATSKQLIAYARSLMVKVASASREVKYDINRKLSCDFDALQNVPKVFDNGIVAKRVNGGVQIITPKNIYDLSLSELALGKELSDDFSVSLVDGEVVINQKLLSSVDGLTIPYDEENLRYALPVSQLAAQDNLLLTNAAIDNLAAYLHARRPVMTACGKLVMPRIVLMGGESGGGKSTLPRFVAAATGRPILEQDPHRDMTDAKLYFGLSIRSGVELQAGDFLIANSLVDDKPITAAYATSNRAETVYNEANVAKTVWGSLMQVARGEREVNQITPAMRMAKITYHTEGGAVFTYNHPELFGGTGEGGNRYLYPASFAARCVKIYFGEPLVENNPNELQGIMDDNYASNETFAARQAAMNGITIPERQGYSQVEESLYPIKSAIKAPVVDHEALAREISAIAVSEDKVDRGQVVNEKQLEEFIKAVLAKYNFDPIEFDARLNDFSRQRFVDNNERYMAFSSLVLGQLLVGIGLEKIDGKDLARALGLAAPLGEGFVALIKRFNDICRGETIDERDLVMWMNELDNNAKAHDCYLEGLGMGITDSDQPVVDFTPRKIVKRMNHLHDRVKAAFPKLAGVMYPDNIAPDIIVIDSDDPQYLGYFDGRNIVVTNIDDKTKLLEVAAHEGGHFVTDNMARNSAHSHMKYLLGKNVELFSELMPLISSDDPLGYFERRLVGNVNKGGREGDPYIAAAFEIINAIARRHGLREIKRDDLTNLGIIVRKVQGLGNDGLKALMIEIVENYQRFFDNIQDTWYESEEATVMIKGVRKTLSLAGGLAVAPRMKVKKSNQPKAEVNVGGEKKEEKKKFIADDKQRENNDGRGGDLPEGLEQYQVEYEKIMAPKKEDDGLEVRFVSDGGTDINAEAYALGDMERALTAPQEEEERKGVAHNVLLMIDTSGSIENNKPLKYALEDMVYHYASFLIGLSGKNPDLNLSLGTITSRVDMLFTFEEWKKATTPALKKALVREKLSKIWSSGDGAGLNTPAILEVVKDMRFPRPTGKKTYDTVIVFTDAQEPGGKALQDQLRDFSDQKNAPQIAYVSANCKDGGKLLEENYHNYYIVQAETSAAYMKAFCQIATAQVKAGKLEGNLNPDASSTRYIASRSLSSGQSAYSAGAYVAYPRDDAPVGGVNLNAVSEFKIIGSDKVSFGKFTLDTKNFAGFDFEFVD